MTSTTRGYRRVLAPVIYDSRRAYWPKTEYGAKVRSGMALLRVRREEKCVRDQWLAARARAMIAMMRFGADVEVETAEREATWRLARLETLLRRESFLNQVHKEATQ